MIFVFKKWKRFCKTLKEIGITSVTASSLGFSQNGFLVLKHDVETNVKKAYEMAKIESELGHCGSYYVQAYLMNDPKNVLMLQKMQSMGHEVSYHYDVLDSAHGDFELAKKEFKKNLNIFERNGFQIETVCQHGNPLIERIGYTSNRDFFRRPDIQREYSSISDIMVNFKSNKGIDYLYFSDAGRHFKLIYDPLFNDVNKNDDKDVPYGNLSGLTKAISVGGNYIISTHPHRWCSFAFTYLLKNMVFKIVKFVAKLLYRIPFMKKFISKHYGLAKKL